MGKRIYTAEEVGRALRTLVEWGRQMGPLVEPADDPRPKPDDEDDDEEDE